MAGGIPLPVCRLNFGVVLQRFRDQRSEERGMTDVASFRDFRGGPESLHPGFQTTITRNFRLRLYGNHWNHCRS